VINFHCSKDDIAKFVMNCCLRAYALNYRATGFFSNEAHNLDASSARSKKMQDIVA